MLQPLPFPDIGCDCEGLNRSSVGSPGNHLRERKTLLSPIDLLWEKQNLDLLSATHRSSEGFARMAWNSGASGGCQTEQARIV